VTRHDARVQGLVNDGRISPDEGERLRRALRGHSLALTIVRNPVEYLRPRWAWMLAISVVVASLAVSQLGLRFDGALDVHRVAGTPAWRTAFVDQFVAVPFTALVFWLASLAVWRRGRWQDFALAAAIARVPALLLCVWSLLVVPDVPGPEEIVRMAQSGEVPVRLLISNLVSLPLLASMIFWLYRGFAFSAGARGPGAGVTFVVALVVAEVASKPLIAAMIRGVTW
jgi:hypothetical protein